MESEQNDNPEMRNFENTLAFIENECYSVC